MISLPDSWRDTCGACGADLPIDAPSHQKFCSPQCREVAYEIRRIERKKKQAAERRAARLAVKSDRPCTECGAVIPAAANINKQYCSDLCQRQAYYRRIRAAKLESRRAAREAMRAARMAAE